MEVGIQANLMPKISCTVLFSHLVIVLFGLFISDLDV